MCLDVKRPQAFLSRYSAQIRASLNDPLTWRRIIACIMLGMAWSFQRAPDTGVAGYIDNVIGFISAHEVAYILVGCGVYILARPESIGYQIGVLPLVFYAAIAWSYLKTLPPDQQDWADFFLYALSAAIAFWLPSHWPGQANSAKPIA